MYARKLVEGYKTTYRLRYLINPSASEVVRGTQRHMHERDLTILTRDPRAPVPWDLNLSFAMRVQVEGDEIFARTISTRRDCERFCELNNERATREDRACINEAQRRLNAETAVSPAAHYRCNEPPLGP